MKFVNVEIKTLEDGSVEREASKALDEAEANHDYFARCSEAALSGLPYHAVTMLDSEGRMIQRQGFKPKEKETATATDN